MLTIGLYLIKIIANQLIRFSYTEFYVDFLKNHTFYHGNETVLEQVKHNRRLDRNIKDLFEYGNLNNVTNINFYDMKYINNNRHIFKNENFSLYLMLKFNEIKDLSHICNTLSAIDNVADLTNHSLYSIKVFSYLLYKMFDLQHYMTNIYTYFSCKPNIFVNAELNNLYYFLKDLNVHNARLNQSYIDLVSDCRNFNYNLRYMETHVVDRNYRQLRDLFVKHNLAEFNDTVLKYTKEVNKRNLLDIKYNYKEFYYNYINFKNRRLI